jgi:signal transduction histidine kinase
MTATAALDLTPELQSANCLAAENQRLRRELNACHGRVLAATKTTREQIERDLHDGMQQRLVSVAMSLGLLYAKLPHHPQAAKEIAGEARQALALALEDLRDVASGQAPAGLAEQGLGRAIVELCHGVAIETRLELSLEPQLPEAVETDAYYLVSEAVTNAIKHSRAQKLRVAASHQDAVLYIEVADDGIGGATPTGGTGLIGLARRVKARGGALSVSSPHGRGTTLRAALPCDRNTPLLANP